jgi:hypothetical protein
VSDRYRQRLIVLRDEVTRLAADGLRSIDLDRNLDDQIATYTALTTRSLEAAQREAARMASIYVPAYLAASGATSSANPIDHTSYSGIDLFGRRLSSAVASAPVAMLWRLGRSDGRATAVATGFAKISAVSRTAVMGSARTAQGDQMAAEPAIRGWRRVTSSRPCGACLAAADGEISPVRSDFPLHDACRCTAEPAIEGHPDRYPRPTGQDIFDRLSADEQAALFAGRGGADKAALVREAGVTALLDRRGGRITEKALTDL